MADIMVNGKESCLLNTSFAPNVKESFVSNLLRAGMPCDFLPRINQHWLTFDPPSPFVHAITTVAYGLICLIGATGNALVLFLVFRCRSLRYSTNFFLVNLAVSDLVMMATVPIIIRNSLKGAPVLGGPGCDAIGLLGGLSGTVSIVTMAAIAVERFFGIKNCWKMGSRVIWPSVIIPTWKRVASLAFFWAYGLCFSIVPLLPGTGIYYAPEGFLTTCSFDYLDESYHNKVYIWVFFAFAYVVPLTVIMASYCSIFIFVRHNSRAMASSQSTNRRPNQEVQLAKIVAALIALWAATWTPYSIVALLGISGRKEMLSPRISMIPAIICKACSALDPYVYTLTHPKFKRELCRKAEEFIHSAMTHHSNEVHTPIQLRPLGALPDPVPSIVDACGGVEETPQNV